jgi:hypothetical protein
LLDGLEHQLPSKPDPELVTRVDEAIEELEPNMRDIIRMRFYDGMSTKEIAHNLGKPEKNVVGIIYEAKRQLKFLLAEFVNKRWGLDVNSLCKICVHPERGEIEKVLKSKSQKKSWKKIIERVHFATGERFHPPQILKAHLKHMNHTRDGKNERR